MEMTPQHVRRRPTDPACTPSRHFIRQLQFYSDMSVLNWMTCLSRGRIAMRVKEKQMDRTPTEVRERPRGCGRAGRETDTSDYDTSDTERRASRSGLALFPPARV